MPSWLFTVVSIFEMQRVCFLVVSSLMMFVALLLVMCCFMVIFPLWPVRNVRGLTFSYKSLLQKFKSLLYSSVLTGEFIAYMDNIVVKECNSNFQMFIVHT